MSSLAGKCVVFTGTLAMKREDAKAAAELAGAKVSSGVTGKTDILIVGKEPGMSKVSKARDRNIRLVSLSEIVDCVEQPYSLTDAPAAPFEIKSFSKGYRGNGLFLTASPAEAAYTARISPALIQAQAVDEPPAKKPRKARKKRKQAGGDADP